MIDSQLLATARAEFSALNFTAENDRIAALEVERLRIDGAITAAEQRTRELSAEISTIIRANPGEAIADALLDNVAPTDAATAAPGRDAMIEERAKLNGGIAELRRRDTDVYHEIRAVQLGSFDKVKPTATRALSALRHCQNMKAPNAPVARKAAVVRPRRSRRLRRSSASLATKNADSVPARVVAERFRQRCKSDRASPLHNNPRGRPRPSQSRAACLVAWSKRWPSSSSDSHAASRPQCLINAS